MQHGASLGPPPQTKKTFPGHVVAIVTLVSTLFFRASACVLCDSMLAAGAGAG